MKKDLFPKAVLKLLKENGIEEEDIFAASATDMNTDCLYADGFVVLTLTQLAIVMSAPDEKEIHSFKGYMTKQKAFDTPEKEWTVKIYPIENMENLKGEPQVACSILTADVDGVTYRLTAFSNLYKREMHKLVRTFDKICMEMKADKELEGKDFGEGKDLGNTPEHGPGRGPWEGGKDGDKEPESKEERIKKLKVYGVEDEKEKDEYCPTCGMMYPDRSRKVCPRCMDRKSIFFRVIGYFKPYRARIAGLFLCYIATAGLNLVWPYLNGTVLYDKVLAKNNEFLARFGIEDGKYITALLMVVLTMLMARITIIVIGMIQGVFAAKIVTGVVRDMKKSIFGNMGKLSISFFRSRQTGSLMTRVMSDADRVTGFFIDGCPYIFINGLTIIVSLCFMFSIKWQMTLMVLVVMPFVMLIGLKLRPRIWTQFGHRHRAERAVNSQVNDNLTGARVVKAFGQENRETKRFEKNNLRLRDAEMSIVGTQNLVRGSYSGIFEILNISVWLIGVYLIMVAHEIELGVMITFVGYIGQLQGPINFFSRVFHWWSDSMNSAQRMFEIIDSVPDIREAENPIELDNPKGRIELKNVSFGYEVNRPVLKELNLEIKEGSMLGIVGRSGAGKTTLVNLISRMYDPQEGQILIDGKDIKDLSFKSLRRNVAMVSQETYIFMGTVEENIAYANPEASHADVIRAAKLASAHEFIMRMPDGYDTRIGSSGRELSGGEKQRISIARAILSNPKILILDEATASVDTETERDIQKSISYLIKGRTTISIAHRLSTLKDADYLVVIDNGKITERGTHSELEALKGTYYKLMELQRKALALKGIE
ncbi:MAG: ABC transporter ATP-binding protein [Lachnospiraceae bacterium]|nr:ABC transporter ATP-binding protein [Lachnospiraceae bacterium]